MARQNGWPDSSACHPNIGIRQLTLKLADGSYMALAPAFSVIHDRNDFNPRLQTEYFDGGYGPPSIVEDLFDEGKQYPFNRYRDTASSITDRAGRRLQFAAMAGLLSYCGRMFFPA
jgi:hypothetical protein